jgi:hypothetical protein
MFWVLSAPWCASTECVFGTLFLAQQMAQCRVSHGLQAVEVATMITKQGTNALLTHPSHLQQFVAQPGWDEVSLDAIHRWGTIGKSHFKSFFDCVTCIVHTMLSIRWVPAWRCGGIKPWVFYTPLENSLYAWTFDRGGMGGVQDWSSHCVPHWLTAAPITMVYCIAWGSSIRT